MAAYRTVVLLVTALFCFAYLSYTQIMPEGKLMLKWQNQFNQYINAFAMTPFGHRISIGTAEGDVFVYEETGQLICQKTFSSPVQELFFSSNGQELYVKTYNLLLLDIKNNSVIWEKFKPNHYIEKVWTYRNGNIGLLFLSKTNLEYVFMLINSKGHTLQEFNLPEMYDKFEPLCSDEDNYLFIASESNDLYHMSLNGMVNWFSRLDPPSVKSNDQPSFWLDINSNGEVCLAYTHEQFGKKGFLVVYYNEAGDVLWQNEIKQPIIHVQFSDDGKKVMVNTMEEFIIFRTNGSILLNRDQWGYYSLQAHLMPTSAMIGFYSKYLIQNMQWSSNNEYPNKAMLRLMSLDFQKTKWQKRLHYRDQYFLVSSDGRKYLEIIKPDTIQLYQYQYVPRKT